MKKTLKWLAGIGAALVLLVILAVTVFLNPMVEKLKPTILAKAQEILKTPVDIEAVSISLFPTTELELTGAAIGGSSGISAKRIYLKTNLREVIAGKLAVSDVTIESPAITIEKLADGSLKIGELVVGGKKESTDRRAPVKEASSATPGGASAAPGDELTLNKLRVKGGSIAYRDQSLSGPLTLSDLDLTVNDLSLSGDASFNFVASMLASKPENIKIAGQFSLKSLMAGKPNLSFTLTNSSFSLSKIRDLLQATLEKSNSVLAANGDLLFGATGELVGDSIKATASFSLPNGEILYTPQGGSPLKIEKLESKLHLTKTSVVSEALSFIFQGEKFEIEGDLVQLRDEMLVSNPKRISAFGGELSVKTVIDRGSAQTLSGEIHGRGMNVSRILTVASGDSKGMSGTIESLDTTYSASLKDPKNTAAADFSAKLKEGEIGGVNILGKSLEGIGTIPGLEATLTGMVPEKYRPLLSKDESTAFDSLIVEGALAGGKNIQIKRAEVQHPAYLLTGNGSLSTEGPMNIKSQMKLGKDMVSGMVSRTEKLKLLLDGSGALSFPVVITRASASSPILVMPDATALAKNALKGGASEGAAKALDRVAPGLGTGAKGLLNKLF